MGRVVHFEVPVDDPERARTFYESALGWSFQGWGDQPYWLTAIGPEDAAGIEGALIGRSEIHAAPVLVVGVEDLDATLARVAAAGGEALTDRDAVPGIGWAAYVRDPEGNVIGLFQPDDEAG
jgi:predicted enzyme related to lactoylglutathione lyase